MNSSSELLAAYSAALIRCFDAYNDSNARVAAQLQLYHTVPEGVPRLFEMAHPPSVNIEADLEPEVLTRRIKALDKLTALLENRQVVEGVVVNNLPPKFTPQWVSLLQVADRCECDRLFVFLFNLSAYIVQHRILGESISLETLVRWSDISPPTHNLLASASNFEDALISLQQVVETRVREHQHHDFLEYSLASVHEYFQLVRNLLVVDVTLLEQEKLPAASATLIWPFDLQFKRLLSVDGGTADVWQARWLATDLDVAVKVFRPADVPEYRSQITVELTTAESNRRPVPHLVRPFGKFASRSIKYIVMELMRGGSVTSFLATPEDHHWSDVLQVACDMADAVQFVHARGEVHRDVKPLNFLITSAGRATFSDFGLMRKLAIAHMHRVIETTKGYWPPEYFAQLSPNPPSQAADIFSLAISYWELITGSPISDRFPGQNVTLYGSLLGRGVRPPLK
jgi:hypothetical protein